MRTLLLPLFLLLLIGAPASAHPQDWPPVTVGGLSGVVMPRDVAESIIWSEDDIEGYWLPGEPWLEKTEDALAAYPETITDPDRVPIPGGYRQYGGYIEHGQRKIFINSFCKEFDNWRRSYVLVMDGGPCFWEAVYNVDSGEVERLNVNGVA